MPTEHVNSYKAFFLTFQHTHILMRHCYQGQLTVACDAAALSLHYDKWLCCAASSYTLEAVLQQKADG